MSPLRLWQLMPRFYWILSEGCAPKFLKRAYNSSWNYHVRIACMGIFSVPRILFKVIILPSFEELFSAKEQLLPSISDFQIPSFQQHLVQSRFIYATPTCLILLSRKCCLYHLWSKVNFTTFVSLRLGPIAWTTRCIGIEKVLQYIIWIFLTMAFQTWFRANLTNGMENNRATYHWERLRSKGMSERR